MILEFYGLPGTGKSTIVSSLIGANPMISFIPDGKSIAKSRLIKNMLTVEFVRFYWLSVILYKKKGHDDVARGSLKFMLRTYLKYMCLRKDAAIYCNDHGIYQCLSSLVWEDEKLVEDAVRIAEYVSSKFSDSVLFIFAENSNFDEVLKRNVDRNKTRRLGTLKLSDQRKLLSLQRSMFRRFCDSGKKHNCTFEIDTMQSVDHSSNTIIEFIHKV